MVKILAYVTGREFNLMSHSLSELEQRREVITRQIAQLDDFFRPGSMTNTSRRCGKSVRRCHQLGQPGHGPNLRLTHKVNGKSISESLSGPAAIHKAEREVAQSRKYQQLSREFVEANAEICASGRPRMNRRRTKKTAEAIRREIAREDQTVTGDVHWPPPANSGFPAMIKGAPDLPPPACAAPR